MLIFETLIDTLLYPIKLKVGMHKYLNFDRYDKPVIIFYNWSNINLNSKLSANNQCETDKLCILKIHVDSELVGNGANNVFSVFFPSSSYVLTPVSMAQFLTYVFAWAVV